MGDRLVLVYVGLMALVLLGAVALQLTPSARLRRRRRRSHARLVSKSRKPMVRFSVRRPKDS